MIILPERNAKVGRILLPQNRIEWQQPSAKRGVLVRHSLTAWRREGTIQWRGWFDDREDADAFLFAMATGSIRYERELWGLPVPSWHPGIGTFEELSYEFVTLRYVTSTSGSNQTDTVPSDWNSANNFIDTLSGGGGGGGGAGGGVERRGGGGCAWARGTNVTLTPSGSATFHLEVAAAAAATATIGNSGADCWYNGTTLAGSSVGSPGGTGGDTGSGGIGGAAASCRGGAGGGTTNPGTSFSRSGGNSGTATTNDRRPPGGGGAGGPTGAGNNGDNSGATVANGGSADAGVGGAGGAGATTGAGPGGTGGTGTEYDGSHGSGGGGGGGSFDASVNLSGGTGGLYGGGGGGSGGGGVIGTAGGVGLIIMSYTPAGGGARSMGMFIG